MGALFIKKEKTVNVQFNSRHADDVKRPIRGALDRNIRKKKTEDRTPIKKADAGEKV